MFNKEHITKTDFDPDNKPISHDIKPLTAEVIDFVTMQCSAERPCVLALDVALKCTTIPKHCCMATALPNDSGLPQQDNASHHNEKTVQEPLEEHGKEPKALTWPPNSPNPNPIKHLRDAPEQATGPNIPVPDTTGHPKRSRVHALTGQNCFSGTRGTYTQ